MSTTSNRTFERVRIGKSIVFLLMLLWCFSTALVYGQGISSDTASSPVLLTISGFTDKPVTLTLSDITALPQKKVKAKDHDEKEYTFEGVTVAAILQKAGFELDDKLRGKMVSKYLLIEAKDGYKAVIALPELDSGFTDKTIILAVKKDGKPLDEKEAPFRVVIPDEKKQARWVRQVITLKICSSPE